MGVRCFYSFFKKILGEKGNIVSLDNYSGKIVIVDANQTIYSLCISKRSFGGEFVRDDGRAITHLLSLFMFVSALIKHGILPIFVFDGRAPIEKRDAIEERHINKKIAWDRMYEECSYNTKIQMWKQSFHLTSSMTDECKKLLEYMGVPVINAPGEADPICANLSTILSDDCAGVITEDSDILVFGGTKILKNFSFRKDTAIEISYHDVIEFLLELANKIRTENGMESIDSFDKENLIDFSIIMGTNYDCSSKLGIKHKITGLSVSKLFEIFVLSEFKIPVLWKKIKDQMCKDVLNSITISDDYVEYWMNIRKIYMKSETFDDEFRIHFTFPDIDKIYQLMCIDCGFDEDVILSELASYDLKINYEILFEMYHDYKAPKLNISQTYFDSDKFRQYIQLFADKNSWRKRVSDSKIWFKLWKNVKISSDSKFMFWRKPVSKPFYDIYQYRKRSFVFRSDDHKDTQVFDHPISEKSDEESLINIKTECEQIADEIKSKLNLVPLEKVPWRLQQKTEQKTYSKCEYSWRDHSDDNKDVQPSSWYHPPIIRGSQWNETPWDPGSIRFKRVRT